MVSKNLFPVLLFILFFTAACSQTALQNQAPTSLNPAGVSTSVPPTASNTSASQQQPTSTAQPQVKNLPQPQASDTPLPQDLQSAQSQSNCTDSASFVADVTIPDNATIDQGASFLKTWRIRNTGTCSWNENYSMDFVNGDQMNSVPSIPFKVTAPGSTLDLSVNLVAPSTAGAYTGNYELRNPAGALFLVDNTRYIWVKITVGAGTAQLPSVPVASNSNSNGTAGNCSYFEDSAVENELVSQINAVRANYGLPALTRNAKLSTAALSHSIDMACHSSIDHTGSDGSTITGRMTAYGYGYSYWNEAIYAQPPQYGGNAQAAVDWWLNDPPHRVILLSAEAKDIGPGYAYVEGSKLGGYFTIDVASPAP
jgi:uncharacterized protein YkwD